MTVHHDKFLIIKPTRCTNFSNLFLECNSTCFGQLPCPSSGVSHCTHSSRICHTGFLTAVEQNQDGTQFHPDPARFPVPVQTSPKPYPTSCTTSTRCFTGGNADRRGVDRPPPSSAEAANGLRLNVRLLSVPAYPCHGGDLYLHT